MRAIEPAAMFSSRWAMEPVPGMASVTGERARSQASAICETVAPCRAATLARRASLRSVWPLPIGPKGTKAMPLAAQASRTAASSRLAIWKLILHGRDRGDGARLGEMVGIDVAETEVTDQALLAQRGERLEAFGERFAVRGRHHADAQVHEVEAVQAQGLRGSPRPGRAGRAAAAWEGPFGPKIGPTLVAITRPDG